MPRDFVRHMAVWLGFFGVTMLVTVYMFHGIDTVIGVLAVPLDLSAASAVVWLTLELQRALPCRRCSQENGHREGDRT